jgi:hypothetical protein
MGQILCHVVRYSRPSTYSAHNIPGPALTSLMRVCSQWEVSVSITDGTMCLKSLAVKLVAGSAIYATVKIETKAGLRSLASLLRHASRESSKAIGSWITKLCIEVEDDQNITWESLIAILVRTPNLASFEMQTQGMRAVFLDPLLATHASRTILTHLALVILPNRVDILPLISYFEKLESLNIYFVEDEQLFQHAPLDLTLSPLFLPQLRKLDLFIGVETGLPAGITFIYGYIGRSVFSDVWALHLRSEACTEETFLLLDPLFKSHSCSKIHLEGFIEIPVTSSIFLHAQRVKTDHIFPPELFKTARLPLSIRANIPDAAALAMFWEILEILVASKNHFKTRIHISLPWDQRFSWTPGPSTGPSMGHRPVQSADFTGNLQRYVIPLLQKGIDIIDEDGKGFRDHFRRILA